MLLLLGCAPHVGIPNAPPHLDARALLAAADPAVLTPWRATVVAIGPFELVPGRRTFSPEPTEPFDTLVVDDGGDVVRVLADDGAIRVIVGVRREDLAVRPIERVALAQEAANAGMATDDPGVTLAGGTAATVDVHVGSVAHVVWEDVGLRVDGWLADSQLGRVWRYSPFDMDAVSDLVIVDPTGGDGLPPVLRVRDAPDGALLGVARNGWMLLLARGAAVDGWRPVEVRTAAARVVGWVRADAVAASDGYGFGEGVGGGTLEMSDVSWVELGEGTWISVEGEATPFARVTADTRVVLREDHGGTLVVGFRTAWGWLDGVVACGRRTVARESAAGFRCGP